MFFELKKHTEISQSFSFLSKQVEEAIAVLQAHQAKQMFAAKQAATNAASP